MCNIDALMMFKYVKPRTEEGRTRTMTFAALSARRRVEIFVSVVLIARASREAAYSTRTLIG